MTDAIGLDATRESLTGDRAEHIYTIDALLALAGMELHFLTWDIPAQVSYKDRRTALFMMNVSHPVSVWQSTLAEYLADPDAFRARRKTPSYRDQARRLAQS